MAITPLIRHHFSPAGQDSPEAVYRQLVSPPPEAHLRIPESVRTFIGPETNGISAFNEYLLGAFIDSEHVWVIDVSPPAAERIVKRLGVKPVETVPPRFFGLGFREWPLSRPPGSLAFKSPGFTLEERGEDGYHFFLLHDPKLGRAFVWIKDNF